MGVIITRSTRIIQPQSDCGISAIWRPIVGFLSNPGGSEATDLATGKRATAYGTITNSPGPKGRAGFASSASDTRYSWDTKPVSSYNNGYAVLVLANPSSGAAVNRFCVIGDEAASSYTTATMAFNANAGSSLASGSTAIFEYSSGFTASAEASSTVDGLWHAYIFNRQAGTVAPQIYVDGTNKTTSSTGATGASATVGIHTHGAPLSTTAGYTNGIALAAVFTRSLTSQEIVSLSGNPWQLFAPIQRRIWVPAAAGGNATATLTGASTTASAGTLVATGGASVTLTGASTAASAGTVSASASTNASTTLTGAATAASAGTITATGGSAVTLTGASTTASAGTVTATAGGNATVTLPSASTTSSAGTLSATGGASKTLSGASTTASAGAVLASAGTNASVTLTGASTSAAVGALSASGAAQIVLPGVQVTASAGTVTATGVRNASVTLTGTAVMAYAGAVSAYAGILNVFTRPPKSATLHGKSRQVAVLLSRPDRDIGNILKD